MVFASAFCIQQKADANHKHDTIMPKADKPFVAIIERIKKNDALILAHVDRESFWARAEKDGPIPENDPSLGKCWIYIGNYNTPYGRCSYQLFRVRG